MSKPTYKLRITHGPDAGRVFQGLAGQTVQIGRSQEMDLVLEDPAVSRQQCRIVDEVEGAQLVAVSSTVPTKVNGRPVSRHRLVPGDAIEIGATLIDFYLVGDGDAETHRQPPAAVTATERQQWAEQLVGTKLHRYEMTRKLAEGTSGAVFLADVDDESTPVAVKVVWPHLVADEPSRQRFVRAMRTMYPLRSRHLIRIDNAGFTPEFCWVAMEYVEGENLRQMMDRLGAAGRLDWMSTYRIAVHVTRALVTAYEHHVVHRNILPRNILVRKEDKSAVLGDLMLAKAMELDEAQQITRAGELVGTIAYLAPERTAGTVEVDSRSDLYSLGATLYELLTGRPPFVEPTLGSLLIAIRTAPVVPIREFQLSVDDRFAGVVAQLLEKDPQRRPQTPMALLKELERIGHYAGLTA